MATVAEYGPTVVFSSHQLNELERVADYLVLINAGWRSQPARLEDIVLAYLRDPGQSALPGPELAVSATGGPQ